MENIVSAALKSKCPFITSRGNMELKKLWKMPAKRYSSFSANHSTVTNSQSVSHGVSHVASHGASHGASKQELVKVNLLVYSGTSGTNVATANVKHTLICNYNAMLRLADYKCPFVTINPMGLRHARFISTTAPPRAKIITNDLELLKKHHHENIAGTGASSNNNGMFRN